MLFENLLENNEVGKYILEALKRSQNDKNVILPITFYAFLAIFSKFLKIFHKIWKNLNFLPQFSYFMAHHSKIHDKVTKFNNKLKNPVFAPSGHLWISKNSKIPQQKF